MRRGWIYQILRPLVSIKRISGNAKISNSGAKWFRGTGAETRDEFVEPLFPNRLVSHFRWRIDVNNCA